MKQNMVMLLHQIPTNIYLANKYTIAHFKRDIWAIFLALIACFMIFALLMIFGPMAGLVV